MAYNELRHSPAVPAVMQVLEALRLVWQTGVVGGPFSHRLVNAYIRAIKTQTEICEAAYVIALDQAHPLYNTTNNYGVTQYFANGKLSTAIPQF